MKSKCSKKGFTIIELLVVIAIIGVLAVVAIVSYANAKMRTRDARRIVDMQSLKSSVLIYKDATNSYPVNQCGGAYCWVPAPVYAGCKTERYMNQAEADSVPPGSYNNCNINIFYELIEGGYIDKLPMDPGVAVANSSSMRYYWYYHNMDGHHVIITTLEILDPADQADAYVLPDFIDGTGSWGCTKNSGGFFDSNRQMLQNSYCLIL